MPRQTQEPMVHQSRTKSIYKVSYALIVVVVLGTAGYFLFSAFRSRTPEPAANTIDIAGSMGGFDQHEIRVKAGEPITVRLTSVDNQYHTDGGGQHQWAVDELGLNVIAPPLGNSSITFTPQQPGTYEFYCDICCGGRANPSMQGLLVVEA